MKKYFDVFKFNLKTELNFKVDYIFSLFAFLVHVFVLRELWHYILQGKAINGYNRDMLVWYITLGEFVMYTISKKNFRKISDLIKSGNIANLLSKPVSIIKYFFAEECTIIVPIIVNFVFAMTLGTIMASFPKVTFIQLMLFLLSTILAVTISILVQLFLGLLAFITEENESFYLIIQKAMLIIVFTPIEFFPSAVQIILRFLPTTYAVYPLGTILTNFEIHNALFLILCQVLSIILMLILVNILNRKGVRRVNVNGG